MRKLIIKLTLFFSVPLILNLIFVIITPPNFFTFRSWEALQPHNLNFNGPFYPNQTLEMIEFGDLGKATEFAIAKPVEFVTDRYGYRNDNHSGPYNVVIIGDSMTAGSSLTQSDTLATVLSNNLGTPVYAFAPASIEQFIQDGRFIAETPQIVIFQIVERNLEPDICPQNLTELRSPKSQEQPNPHVLQLRVLYDRFLRNTTYLENYLQSGRTVKQLISNTQGMVFYQRSLVSKSHTKEDIHALVTSMKRCADWFNQHGMEFIVLPVPDKENIYFDEIPAADRPAMTAAERSLFLQTSIQAMRDASIPVIDLLAAYEQSRANGNIPYQLDDTHWNPTGVKIASEMITELVTKPAILAIGT